MNFIGPIFNPTDIIFSLQNNRTALNPVQEGFYSSIRHCCVEYAKYLFCNTFLTVHSFVISKKMSINIKKILPTRTSGITVSIHVPNIGNFSDLLLQQSGFHTMKSIMIQQTLQRALGQLLLLLF